MKPRDSRLPLVLIAGPTASGKSALALALSRRLPVTIINADASQVYADLSVVSARPTPEEMKAAPHRLFGHVDGACAYSAAEWANDAKIVIEKAREKYHLPILVGGTGLYLRTLLDGIAPVPEIDPAIRAAVRALPVADAYAALTSEDAEAAARLNPADTTRICRALEVVRSTGKPLLHWQADRAGGIGGSVRLVPLLLLPPRDWLGERCDARFLQMLETGGKEEVAALIARNLDPDLPVMRAIGVREIAAILSDPDDAVQHIEKAQIATRQYAKRQFTWFRNQSPADWPRHEEQLNNDFINELAIILHERALTY
jgi:tRNA dimethylallyltransferase